MLSQVQDLGSSHLAGVLIREPWHGALSQNFLVLWCPRGEVYFFHVSPFLRLEGTIVRDGLRAPSDPLRSVEVRSVRLRTALKARLLHSTWQDLQVLRQLDVGTYAVVGGRTYRVDPWSFLVPLRRENPEREEACEEIPRCAITQEAAPLFCQPPQPTRQECN